MALGPYRDAAEVIADEAAEQCLTLECEEDIGPVVVRVHTVHDAALAMPSDMRQGLRLIAALAGLGLLVILGMVAFAGP